MYGLWIGHLREGSDSKQPLRQRLKTRKSQQMCVNGHEDENNHEAINRQQNKMIIFAFGASIFTHTHTHIHSDRIIAHDR